jgi:hypothetical protein
MATGAPEVAVARLLNLKSKLERAEAITVAEVRGRSDAEDRCGCDTCAFPSLFLAFSTALRSYSSHSLAVVPGVVGGVLGSLNGDIVLASGEGWCGANVIVGVADVIVRLWCRNEVLSKR